MKKPFVLGVAGGSGSGKSTIVQRLLSSVHGAQICLLPHDAYYLDHDRVPDAVRNEPNWDHPQSLDNALYVEHIDRLLSGDEVLRPVYDFATHRQTGRTIPVQAAPVILLEGILLLAIPEIRQRIDLGIFVETPADLRLMRRILRDVEERGRTVQSTAMQYQSTVRRMHAQFVEPSKAHAHIWIPWENDNATAVELLLSRIKDELAGRTDEKC